jgi:DNA-binding MarR family transcriptional regulator
MEADHVATEATEDPTVSAILTVLRISRVLERVDAGISPQQYRILKLIGAGGERSARLAEKLAVAKPTLTSTADSLVSAGLAYREAEPGDRRVVRLRLSEAGLAAMKRAESAYSDWLDSVLEQTGNKDQILADLRMLMDAMSERKRAQHREPQDSASTPVPASAGRVPASAGQQ